MGYHGIVWHTQKLQLYLLSIFGSMFRASVASIWTLRDRTIDSEHFLWISETAIIHPSSSINWPVKPRIPRNTGVHWVFGNNKITESQAHVRLDRWCGKPVLIVNPMVTVIAWEMPHGNAKWSIYGRGHIPPYPKPTLSWVFAHHPGRPGKPKAAHGNPSAAGWMQGLCSSAAGFGHLFRKLPSLSETHNELLRHAVAASLCKNWLNWCFGLDWIKIKSLWGQFQNVSDNIYQALKIIQIIKLQHSDHSVVGTASNSTSEGSPPVLAV